MRPSSITNTPSIKPLTLTRAEKTKLVERTKSDDGLKDLIYTFVDTFTTETMNAEIATTNTNVTELIDSTQKDAIKLIKATLETTQHLVNDKAPEKVTAKEIMVALKNKEIYKIIFPNNLTNDTNDTQIDSNALDNDEPQVTITTATDTPLQKLFNTIIDKLPQICEHQNVEIDKLIGKTYTKTANDVMEWLDKKTNEIKNNTSKPITPFHLLSKNLPIETESNDSEVDEVKEHHDNYEQKLSQNNFLDNQNSEIKQEDYKIEDTSTSSDSYRANVKKFLATNNSNESIKADVDKKLTGFTSSKFFATLKATDRVKIYELQINHLLTNDESLSQKLSNISQELFLNNPLFSVEFSETLVKIASTAVFELENNQAKNNQANNTNNYKQLNNQENTQNSEIINNDNESKSKQQNESLSTQDKQKLIHNELVLKIKAQYPEHYASECNRLQRAIFANRINNKIDEENNKSDRWIKYERIDLNSAKGHATLGRYLLAYAENDDIKFFHAETNIVKLLSKFKLNPIGEYSREASQAFAIQFITDRKYTAFKPNGQFDFDSFKQWLLTSNNPQLQQLFNNLTQRHFEGIYLKLESNTTGVIQYKISFSSGSIVKPSTSIKLSSALNVMFQQQQVINYMLTRFPDTEEARQVITDSVATMAPDELNCAAGLARIAAKGDNQNIYETHILQEYIKTHGGYELVYGIYRPNVANSEFMKLKNREKFVITAKEFIEQEDINKLQSTLDMLVASDGKYDKITSFNQKENLGNLGTMFNIMGSGRIVHPIIRHLTNTLQSKIDPTLYTNRDGTLNENDKVFHINNFANTQLSLFKDYNDVYSKCQQAMATDPHIRSNLIYLTDNYPFGVFINGSSRNILI